MKSSSAFLSTFLLFFATAPTAVSFSPIACSSDDECVDDQPACCGGFCVGCCDDDDCEDDRKCLADNTCFTLSPFCFSGNTILDILGKGQVAMQDAQVGDRVRTQDDAYTTVYAFGHREPETSASFLQFHLEGEVAAPLEITADHLLLKVGQVNPVPASTIEMGDSLVMADGDTAKVSHIDRVTRTGIYAPLSTSGYLAVNNVVASSYVTAQENAGYVMLGPFSTPVSWHWVSHAFQAPHRLWCSAVSCKETSGTPFQVDLLQLVTYWTSSKRSAWVRYLVVPMALVPTVLVLGALQAIEYGVQHPLALLVALSTAVFIGMQAKLNPKAKNLIA